MLLSNMGKEGKLNLGLSLKLIGMGVGFFGLGISAFRSTEIGGFIVALSLLLITAGDWIK